MLLIAKKYGLKQVAVWTLLLAAMLGITLYVHHQDTLKEALLEARHFYRFNYHYRVWNAEIGGLYAPIEKVLPNPYLTVPGRDITTTDQRHLTLVNPAYMSRMVFEQVKGDSVLPIICRLISLKPINPVNTPDAWERDSLIAFERSGSIESYQVTPLNGAPYLRLISRFVTEKNCLKCHGSQGYKLGDIRGGISIAVPLTPYFAAEVKTRNTIAGGYLLLWLSGSSVLAMASRKRYEQAAALAKEAGERQVAQEHLQEQAVMLEEEIVERRRVEDELRKSEGRYRLLLESVTNYIYTTRVVNGRAVDMSHGPGCSAVTGYGTEEYAADPGLWLRMVPEEDRKEVQEQAERTLDGSVTAPLEHRIMHKNGEIRWIRNTPVPCFDNEGNLIAYDGIVSDITARKHAEEVIKKWKLNLESAQRIAHLGSWELDLGKNELIWSDEIYRIFGLHPQEFSATYDAFLAMVHPDDREYVNDAYVRSVDEDIPYDITHRIIRVSDGVTRYVHEVCEHSRDKGGKVIRSLGTVHDVTERTLAEQKAIRLNHLYTVLSRFNEAIVRIREPECLYKELCRIIVQDGLFRMAWVGLVDRETGMVKPAVHFGHEDGYLEHITISLDPEIPEGRGPTGVALREKRVLVNNSTENNPLMSPWRDEALRRGYLASATFPILSGDSLFGAFTMYAGEADYFDEDEVRLLSSLSDDVSYAVESMKSEAERRMAEERLAERVMLSELSAEIGSVLTMPGDLRKMLSDCTRAIVVHLDAAFARIWTLNSAENILELQASAGMYTRIDGFHSRIPVGTLKIGMIAAERRPVISNAVIGDPLVNDQEWAKREGMVAFAGYPLTIENKLIGVMALFSRNKLSDVSLRALTSISNEIAVGIERKRAEDALIKEKEFLSNLLHGSAIATFVLDPQHRVLLWNQACEKLTGVTAVEVIGTSLHWRAFYSQERSCLADFILDGHTEQLQQLYKHVTTSSLTPEGLQAEGFYPEMNGMDRHILFDAAPIRNGSGTLLGAIETLLDITELKTVEAQLFQAQKMEAVGQLAGGIAHDFNNILTAIIGFSTLIEMHMDADDPQRSNLSNVLAAADRAADLTRSLLTFSRKQVIHPQMVDLNQIIRKIDQFLKRIIGEDIELRTILRQDALTVNADSGQIEQVLMNLATNARDAMPNGGLLSIEVESVELDEEYVNSHSCVEPGRYASVSISDSGEGMDETTCKRIFEPFFTTKEAGKGTGLGLSIVFGIIRQHKGFINVYSEPGVGTTFKIFLPQIQSIAVEKDSCEEEVLESAAGTVLVADDDMFLRDLTEKTLGMFGYTVITAVNGREALARFKENRDKIDLVLLDIIMPEMNGKEAFDEMRKIDPAVKVIFMSGYTGDIVRKRGLLEQDIEFISKPLNLKQLLIRIRDVLEGDV